MVSAKIAPVNEYFAPAPVTIGKNLPTCYAELSAIDVHKSSKGRGGAGVLANGTTGFLDETFYLNRRQIQLLPKVEHHDFR